MLVSWAIRNKLFSFFPFLRLTLRFKFQVSQSLGRCIVLLEAKAVPPTFWRLVFSYALDLHIQPLDEHTAQLYIRRWGLRRSLLEVKGDLSSHERTSTVIEGEIIGDFFFIPFFALIAFLQVLIFSGFPDSLSSVLIPVVVIFWTIGGIVTALLQWQQARRLLRLIKATLGT